MTPLFVDLNAKQIIIFGGGDVAARKAKFFVHDAEVIIFSRSFSNAITDLPVKRQKIDIKELSDVELNNIIENAFICVAALSDQEQNNRIGEICKRKRILFNNAFGDNGDLIIPSAIYGKHYLIAVSTDGKSPATSRFIREHLESEFPCLDAMISLQSIVRKKLIRIEPLQKKRREILWEILHDPDVWDALGRSIDDANEFVMRRYLHG